MNFLYKSKALICFAAFLLVQLANAQPTPETAIQQANHALWTKFIDKYGVVNDFVGERPTPNDCRLSRPNAFGWWTPIEDGAFFTGLYLIAACDRAKTTKNETDRDKARILAQGLLKLSLVSDVPGFIARGVSTDGKTHYPNGSNDQTIPWVYGLYYYLKTDIPTPTESKIMRNKIVEVIQALQLADWRFPSDGMFTGKFRDDLRDNRFLEAPCYLLLLKIMHQLTNDNNWASLYHTAAHEKPEGSLKTRGEVCAEGIEYDVKMWGESKSYLWIYVMKQAALVELASSETDATLKAHFQAGQKRNRDFVMKFAQRYTEFNNHDEKVFGNADWRACYTDWYPQFTIEEAIAVSKLKNDAKIGKRKGYERELMTTPLAAASIMALFGNKADCDLIRKVISHYDYSKLYLGEFLYAEFAYYKTVCQ
ncbi:hypothetical protein [Runella zeae]|uniref:hypothetical protein n=1 Tax=Runella zeae TaxID=94255 RepID=UPI002355FF53|nr:hypothetical protein [Runella zeae]